MHYFFIVALGMLAGLHAACYGAYKDSPYEKFILSRFFREVIIGALSALFILLFTKTDGVSFVILFLSFVACSRIFTETYKQFIRQEPQHRYKIPSMVHIFRIIPTSRLKRLILGILAFSTFILLIAAALQISNFLPKNFAGPFLGLFTGLITGVGGAYKDGFFEGFNLRKFFRSPTLGVLSGFLLSHFSNNPLFLLLSTWGLERMTVEFYKGFIKAKYMPGKFNLTKARYPEFFQKRKRLIPLYITTWVVLLILFIIEIYSEKQSL